MAKMALLPAVLAAAAVALAAASPSSPPSSSSSPSSPSAAASAPSGPASSPFALPSSASSLLGASSGAFLARPGPGADLLDELDPALGRERRASIEARATALEASMNSTFEALPRTAEGRLPSASVRYLLHRTFVERHAWLIQGLEQGVDAALDSASPAELLKSHAGGETASAFERRLAAEGGLTLRETAVLAATLESMVHEENLERLAAAYRLEDLHPEKAAYGAPEFQLLKAIDTYMLMFVLGLNYTTVSADLVARAKSNVLRIYPNWPLTRRWVYELREEVLAENPASRGSFTATANIVESIGNKYGRWQSSECSAMKNNLMLFETPGTGRVPLQNFYSAAIIGKFQFKEKKNFLREIGALDESNPAQPSVVIPNYINSATNCMASSKFYSVCCVNECEPLIRSIEGRIAAPDALPGSIVELVEQLSSATVEAPRSLPASLIQRLEQIAERHGGKVPLHGRLFGQWMHHAYPHECPYPHLSGTTRQISGQDYTMEKGEQASLDTEGLRWEVEVNRMSSAEDRAAEALAALRNGDFKKKYLDVDYSAPPQLPWSSQEEMLVPRPPKVPSVFGSVGWALRSAAMALAAGSLALTTIRTALGPKRCLVDKKAYAKCVV